MAERSTALVFAPGQTHAARRIARIITGGVSTDGCLVCTDEKRFESQLKRLPRLRPITVLLANQPKVLDQVLSLSEWFEDTPLVIMVPDNHHDTIAKAHRLRPRYLMPPEFDYHELESVVHRILKRPKISGAAGLLAKTGVSKRKRHQGVLLGSRKRRRRLRSSVNATQRFCGGCLRRSVHEIPASRFSTQKTMPVSRAATPQSGKRSGNPLKCKKALSIK